MLKRTIDFFGATLGLVLFSPLFLPVMFLVWWQDFHSPFYVAQRVGLGGQMFKMVKLRSMIKGADRSGVDSTASDDRRITAVGHFIRRYKLDELSQLWNVWIGSMSFVGPRPNVERETTLYTKEEQRLLTVKPGITDLASIVFADEGEILKGSSDPDIDYNQLIRPWKNRLALLCMDHGSILNDLRIIYLTAAAILSRSFALHGVVSLLEQWNAPTDLIEVAWRKQPLRRAPPPGASELITSRQ